PASRRPSGSTLFAYTTLFRSYHRELLTEVPRGVLDLLKLPGLGPKGVGLVWTRLGVRSAEDLEAAIADGRFRSLPGMKEKKEARDRKSTRLNSSHQIISYAVF